jgi:SPP1 gp7 family putative phage head morphogenesis protein
VSQAVLSQSMKNAMGLSFSTIGSKKLKQILSSDWSGASWSERLWKDRELVGKKITDILERGMVQGTSLQKMSRELKQATNQSFNNAFRLIRTETSFIDTQVTFEGYEQAAKELGLEYYKYDAHLDSRTSAICREMNDKIFKLSEKEIGLNAPPLHPNCRSTIQLILDEEDMKEPVKELTEFKDFGKFNRKAYGLANFVKQEGKSKKEIVDIARKMYDKNTLNSFYNIGKLTEEQKQLLGTNSDDIKFSLDSMIKNRIEHPDLNFYDYKKIEQILASPDKMQPSKKKKHIVIIKEIDNKPYQLVLKTTKNKKENFVVSFHRCD